MVKVYMRFTGNKIGGIFRKMWTGEWVDSGISGATEAEAVFKLRQWKKIGYLRNSFEYSVGVNPATI